jgi:predicted nucleic acid-binding protein
MTPGIMLDTNVYAAFKRDHPRVLDEVRRAPEIVMSPVVLGELRGGFALGSRTRENERELEAFLAGSRVRVVGITDRTSVFYARLWGALRRRARPIPANDLWIAAAALEHGLRLLTFDGHFDGIDGLAVTTLA